MNLSLSKGGRPASVKNRAWHYCQMAWRGVCNPKALSRLAAFSPLLLLGMGQMAHATDLLAGGKDDVKATFGADSFVVMCIYIAEIIIGVATYTGNPAKTLHEVNDEKQKRECDGCRRLIKIMDDSLLLLRDFSDLTRPELIARLKRLKILQARVAYTHDNFSPRQLRAFILATLMLFMSYVLTDSILFSGVTGLITIIGVLHYSRLPMTWHAQLKDGISRFECLRSSPLRQMDEADAHYDWHYASYCLSAEIQLIYLALSQPARPFSA